MDVARYIRQNWANSIRDGAVKGLPYPFTSPSCEQTGDVGFENFFYWDTYFINIGLLCDGMAEQALNNLKNMAYLIEKYGYMPNVATDGGDNRSQPPMFILMCHAYAQQTGDASFLRRFYGVMEREHAFWMRERSTPCGLNRYGNCADAETHRAFFRVISRSRLGDVRRQGSEVDAGSNLLSEAESGWDFTPRFGGRVEEFAAIDLNSLLYADECILAANAPDLATRERYLSAANERKARIIALCADGDKFYDYDFVNGVRSDTASAAQFLPYLCGISRSAEGARAVAADLERAYGVPATAKTEDFGAYQWSYPNIWPPLQYFAVTALDRVGDREDAVRIAGKFVRMVEDCAERTSSLWEKYDCESGDKAGVSEYAESKMLGWTAGAYRALQYYLETGRVPHEFIW